MVTSVSTVWRWGCTAIVAAILGCGGGTTTPEPVPVPVVPPAVGVEPPATTGELVALLMPDAVEPPLPSISLGGDSPANDAVADSASAGLLKPLNLTPSERRKQVVAAMNALQIMLGGWRGITQKEVGEFKAIEEPKWVWDFRSQPGQPALVMKSEQSQHITEARLTYLIERQLYQLTAKDKTGETRTLEGTFTAPVEEFEGEDHRVHRKYKLQLTEVADARDALQLVFNQQDNNRYQLEVEKKRGQRFVRIDTVGTQREGSSFAINDSDYKERTCVISGGLGTTQVSYNGKSYWVCCSGCKAAFDEEPEKWIAEFEAKQKAQEKLGT